MLEHLSAVDRSSIAFRYDRSDVFRLVPTASVDGGVVVDEATGCRITIDPLGAALMQALIDDDPPSLGDLADHVAHAYEVTPEEAFQRVTRYLDALDGAALVRRCEGPHPARATRTAIRSRGVSMFVVDWLALARGGATVRHPATFRGLSLAVLRTQWILPVAGVVLAAAVLATTAATLGVTHVRESGQIHAVVLTPLLVGVLHVALFWVHEAGHLFEARRRRPRTPPHFVVTRGRKVGIVRAVGERDDEIAISAVGPILAAGAAVGIAAVAVTVAPTGEAATFGELTIGVCLLLGVGHLLSLLPFAADGHNIWRAVRRHPDATAATPLD